MCGIAGIISKCFIDNTVDNTERTKAMLSSIQHRGPDAEGIYKSHNICLGQRRLVVIDASETANQPMHFEDCTIVYDGVIYNYKEIKKELIEKGHRFQTASDTEVILHAYKEWGQECLRRFRGKWAFALLDRNRDILFCSRDCFGIKPFYFYSNGNEFIFSSEIKAIIAAGIMPKANYDVLMEYLVVGFENIRSETFFQGIMQLLPANSLILSLKEFNYSIEEYYSLRNVKKEESPELFAQELHKSVELHLCNDIKVGTCLSGGLDSSTVAALAAEILKKENIRLSAVTAQSETQTNDESSYAEKVARNCNIEWIRVKPTYERFLTNIERCLYYQEQPVAGPSVFMQYCVMERAKESGIVVMLDGQGADEILLGYERYYPAYFWHLLKKGRISNLINEYMLAVKHSRLTFLTLAGYAVYFLIPSIRILLLRRRLKFLRNYYFNMGAQCLSKSTNYLNIKDMQVMEIMKYQLPHLLHYADRNSMAHSIEARVPFVDREVIENALALPPSMKINNGYTKFVLREIAEAFIPRNIACRTNKIGFEAPEKEWMPKHLKIMQEKVNKSKILKRICTNIPDLKDLPNKTKWRLYNIGVWEEQYDVEA